MDLVVDANVLFSAAIKDSATAALIVHDDLELFAPEYLFDEFERYRETILERTHRNSQDFTQFVGILRRRISVVPRERFMGHESHARCICPDPGDMPYFALTIFLDASLWSDDKALQGQPDIPVLTTADVLEWLES